jgi:uncharacterized damage-inducible protein DinB
VTDLARFRALSDYNIWINQRLYAACADLSDAERRLDRGAFFHSIHGTLNHLLLGDRLWLARFQQRAYEVCALDDELYQRFDELRDERHKTDREIATWLASLSDEQLAAPFVYRSIVQPANHCFPLWFLITHFFNHQTHHRGQLTTLLHQAGIDVGVTDLIGLPGAALPLPESAPDGA